MIIEGADSLEYRILGPLEVRRDGVVVPVAAARQRAVLAALLLQANRVVPVTRLIALLWGDDPPATAHNTLQTLVHRLRRQLAPGERAGPLQTRAPGYLLRVPRDRLDLYRFEDLFRHGRDALSGGDPEQAGRLLGEAVTLWRGTPLADVGVEELRRAEGTRLAEWYLQAVEERVEADLRRGWQAELVGELRRLVAEHPLRERPYGQLMRALSQSGRQAEALETYRALRKVLVEQLGVEPGPAVQRLHQALLRGEVDAPAYPPPRSPAPRRVPGQLPTDVAAFTGRTAQLAQLDGLLAAGREPGAVPVIAVVGTPGVGKTALAVHWAHRVRDRFPGGQLFLDLHGYATASPLRPIDALAQFLRALGVPPAGVPVDAQEAAALYRSLLADRRVLVVLDNARAADQVQPLLPGSPGCLVLVTSRDRLDGLVAQGTAHRLRLDALPPEEAHVLLARSIGAHRVAGTPAQLADLARRCAYLPLALRLAAANLVARQHSLPEYAARLATGSPLAGLMVVGEDDRSAVRTAFALSYTALPGDAARLFRLLGVLPGVDLPVAGAAALAGVAPERAGQLLDRLAAAHLVDEPTPGRFTFHDLLRHYATELAAADPAADRITARDRLYGWYGATTDAAVRLLDPERLRLPAAGRPSWPPTGWDGPDQAQAWLEAERVNLVRAAERAAADGPRPVAWLLADALRGYLSRRGHLVEWEFVCRAGLAAAEAEGDLAAQSAIRSSLAELRWRQKGHHGAVDLYQQAAELSERAGWLAGQAAALGNLGVLYTLTGQGELAVEYHTRALQLSQRIGWREGQATNLGHLGVARLELGHPKQAMTHLTETLELYRQLDSRDGQIMAHINLGEACLALGRLDQAQDHLTEALARSGRAGRSGEQAEITRLLAEVQHAAGLLGSARELASAAVDLARDTSQPGVEAAALNTLAGIDRSAGALEPAIAGHRLALQLAREIGTPLPEVLAYLGLAVSYRSAGQPGPAVAHAGQALTIARAHGYRTLEDAAVALLGDLQPATASTT